MNAVRIQQGCFVIRFGSASEHGQAWPSRLLTCQIPHSKPYKPNPTLQAARSICSVITSMRYRWFRSSLRVCREVSLLPLVQNLRFKARESSRLKALSATSLPWKPSALFPRPRDFSHWSGLALLQAKKVQTPRTPGIKVWQFADIHTYWVHLALEPACATQINLRRISAVNTHTSQDGGLLFTGH